MNSYFLPFTLRRASYSTGFAIWDKISNYGQRCQEWLKFCIQVLPMFCPTPTFELNVFSGLEYDLPLCSIQLVPYSQRREYRAGFLRYAGATLASPRLCSPCNSRRSRLRALCTCDLEQPVEHPTSPAISLCSYPMTSCIKKSFL